MKKITYSILLLVLTFALNSCSSSINVVKKWTGDNIETMKTSNILVITRTKNIKIRKAFEDEMVKQLIDRGLKATASYKQHPDFKPNEKVTDEKKAQLIAMIEKEGYNSIVLSVLKEELQNVKSTEEGDYYAGMNYYPSYIPVYTYGFYGCFYSPMLYTSADRLNLSVMGSQGTYVPSDIETQTSKSYVLQTLAYNLELPTDKQLVAIVTTKVDEPDNFHTAAKGYAKKVLESFN
jgi:hypothetical protein